MSQNTPKTVTSSRVMTKGGMADQRYEVRVLQDGLEKQVYWSRKEEAGRHMMRRTHLFYRNSPGYAGTRLILVSQRVAVEILEELLPENDLADQPIHYH